MSTWSITSLQALEYLLDLHGFSVVDAQLNDVNGGSIRAFIRNRGADQNTFGDGAHRKQAIGRLSRLRESEAELGLETATPYLELRSESSESSNRFPVSSKIKSSEKESLRLWRFDQGKHNASIFRARPFGNQRRSRAQSGKMGKVTVGTRIPIVSEEAARAAKPDYFLVLPWHFIEEFKAREQPTCLRPANLLCRFRSLS